MTRHSLVPFPTLRACLSACVMWALCAFVTAQEAAVEMTVSSTSVTQGDMLRLTLTFVNCKVKEIEPPQIKCLDWRMGPSTSTSTQWINGVTTSEQSYTYGYTVTAGNEVQIPSFNWRTNKGLLKSNSVRVMVESNQGKATKQRPSGQKTRSVRRDLVTAIEPNKRTVYLREPLVPTYRI